MATFPHKPVTVELHHAMTLEHDVAISIHAYYAGEQAAGRRAIERLLSRPDLPPDLERSTRSNRLWYQQVLADLVPTRHTQIVCEPAATGWSLFNPTILWTGEELLAIIRSSNYRIVDGRYVMPPEDGDTIRTTNLLGSFSRDLTYVNSPRPITGPDYTPTGYPVTGLEDCRLRHTPTGVGVSATVRDVSPHDGRCRIAIADLDVDAAAFSGLLVIASCSTQDHEKNWMPIQSGWIYSLHHAGRIVTADVDPSLANAWSLHARSPSPAIARGFRGGGQVVPFRGGWLAIVHEVAFFGAHRAYEHRFVWLDNELRLARISQPFALLELRAIEFAAGLAVIDDRVVVSYGVRDAEAWLAELAAEDVWKLLDDADAGHRLREARLPASRA